MRNLLLIAMLLAATSGPVGTGAESPESPESSGSDDSSASQATSPATGEEGAESNEDEAPPAEFLPSERVRVDNEVSFPVDI